MEICVSDPSSNSSDLDADFDVFFGEVKKSDRFFSGDGFSIFLNFFRGDLNGDRTHSGLLLTLAVLECEV